MSAGGNCAGGEKAGLHRIEVEHIGEEGRRLVLDFAVDIDAMPDPVSPEVHFLSGLGAACQQQDAVIRSQLQRAHQDTPPALSALPVDICDHEGLPLSIRALRQRFAVRAGLINIKNPRRKGRLETCVHNGRRLLCQFLQQDVGQLRFQAHHNLHMWDKRWVKAPARQSLSSDQRAPAPGRSIRGRRCQIAATRSSAGKARAMKPPPRIRVPPSGSYKTAAWPRATPSSVVSKNTAGLPSSKPR